MKFLKVKIQPHWLAALERAKEVMPNVRWVCAAVDNGFQPEIEKEIRETIHEAIEPWVTVNTWYFHETGQPLERGNEYRITWLNHMIEQCRAMQGELHV